MQLDMGQSYPRQEPRRRVSPAGHAQRDLIRCACQQCGSHVHAVVLKQTISGLCRTCGSCDIAPLS